MKKIFAAFLLTLIICCAFVGCAQREDPPSSDSGVGSLEQSTPDTSSDDSATINEMYLTINSNKLKVTLAKNSSVDALVALLRQGDITYTADDYGGFEKVENLGHTLPADDSKITTSSGDVILYSGNQIVLFYGSNTWQYTRLGRIEGYSSSQLRALLCAGEGKVQIVISLQ